MNPALHIQATLVPLGSMEKPENSQPSSQAVDEKKSLSNLSDDALKTVQLSNEKPSSSSAAKDSQKTTQSEGKETRSSGVTEGANLKVWTAWEQALLFCLIFYLILLILYFNTDFGAIRYLILFSFSLLIPLLPELTTPQRRYFMVAFIAVLSVGSLAVQRNDEAKADQSAAFLKAQVESLQTQIESLKLLKQQQDQIAATEIKFFREEVPLNTLDEVDQLAKTSPGFQKKADRLSLKISLAESQLFLQAPNLVPRLLSFPAGANPKLAAYAALKNDSVLEKQGGPDAVRTVDQILSILKEEVSCRMVADYLKLNIDYKYKDLLSGSDKSDLNVIREHLGVIESSLGELLVKYPIGGLYNYLGNLAIAQSSHSPEGQNAQRRALGYLLLGIGAHPEHVPLYDSLAYASWALAQDSSNALRYAKEGLNLCLVEPVELQTEHNETLRNFDLLTARLPEVRSAIDQKRVDVVSKFKEIKSSIDTFHGEMIQHFELLYAYTSALQIEMKNKDQAYSYARQEYESNRDDAECEDTLGFVLMRYSTDEKDLDEAQELFQEALDSPKSERVTRALSAQHLQELANARKNL